MKLTPMDIHNKEFDVKLHGYDKNQVDVFLDQIIDDYSDALDTIADLESSGADSQAESQEPAESISTSANQESVESEADQVSELLLSAQKSADLIIENARAEADRIIAEANETASEVQGSTSSEEVETELNRNIETLQSDYDRLKKRVADFRDKSRMLLEKEIEGLDDENWQYWLDRYYGTERLYPVDGEPISLTDDENGALTTELDNDSEDNVESNQTVAPTFDGDQIATGDNPTNVSITPGNLPQPDDGPVIIFPDDENN